MAVELTDVFRAASLIQWGLQPRMRPLQNADYRELVKEYMNRSEFRDVVAEMSDGLGLYVLNVSEHGIVLTPREGSVFWMRPSELRAGSSAATDRRLLDGIVQVTIAATVFPRARDLEDDVNRPRPPVTVEEIDDTLRGICANLKKEFANADPDMDDVRTGIYDAWRVYDATLAARETKDGRESPATSTRIIKYNLEKLKEYGCFSETRYAGKEAWQPTRRYNVLVQDIAASRVYDEVMRIQNKHGKDGGNRDLRDFDDDFSEQNSDFGNAQNNAQNSGANIADNSDFSDAAEFHADRTESSASPRVGERIIKYADSYSEDNSKIGGIDEDNSAQQPRVDAHGIEYADSYSEDNSKIGGIDEDNSAQHHRVGERIIEYADSYSEDNSKIDGIDEDNSPKRRRSAKRSPKHAGGGRGNNPAEP